jgi:Ala-tRNA(Pro) deacylase
VRYDVIHHQRDYTAPAAAADTHTPGRQFAKTVALWADGRYLMAVLPAHHTVDLGALRKTLGAQTVNLASEDELEALYPDCEPGAMPPFGPLYHMPVYVSDELPQNDTITFNAGTHAEAIRMAYRDFARLVQPHVVALSKGP